MTWTPVEYYEREDDWLTPWLVWTCAEPAL